VRWGLGLLFIGVAVSRFVWPEKVVDTEIPPPVVASCKDVSRQTLVRLPLDTTTLKPPHGGWIMESGVMPPDILRMRVNISTLMDCIYEVQLALVAWLGDNTADRMTDARIEKSNLFSPVSEQRELQMRVTEAFLRRAAPEHQVRLMLVALRARGLTPSGWSKVTTVSQAVRNGGSVIAEIVLSVFLLLCKCPGKKACSLR
jgi:hypothetical protein